MGPYPHTKTDRPSIIVVDDFLENPDAHREYALTVEYEKKGSVGLRSKVPNQHYGYKDIFQRLLQQNIYHWENSINGCYQWCHAKDPLVYHVDAQTYAGALFLTPDAPIDSGTSFWRSKQSGLCEFYPSNDQQLGDLTFGKRNEYVKDPEQWELVDRIANRYNRLVLWNGRKIHSASSYFGDNVNNARLFQVFFFDCKAEL